MAVDLGVCWSSRDVAGPRMGKQAASAQNPTLSGTLSPCLQLGRPSPLRQKDSMFKSRI